MKKILLSLFVIAAFGFGHPAQAQLLRFYYYPKNNVYYNVSAKEYIYNHDGSWTPVADLPDELEVSGSTRIVMYSMKPDVWIMNEEHQELYRNNIPPRTRVGKLLSFRKDTDEDRKR